MLHAQTVQQRDQAGPAQVFDAAFLLDPGADLARRPRQRRGDPGFPQRSAELTRVCSFELTR